MFPPPRGRFSPPFLGGADSFFGPKKNLPATFPRQRKDPSDPTYPIREFQSGFVFLIHPSRNSHVGLRTEASQFRRVSFDFAQDKLRSRSATAAIAGWRATWRIARSVSCLPGEILCHGDAPDGCGSGIRSKVCPARRTRNLRPIPLSNFVHSMNCAIAKRPTGIMRRGRKLLISSFIHEEQFRISSGAGTRSVPPKDLPGKHRQTAAK